MGRRYESVASITTKEIEENQNHILYQQNIKQIL